MHSDNATRTMKPPPYPPVGRQAIPNLDLAGVSTPRTSLAGGNYTDSTPPQNSGVPPLSTSDPNGVINMLGIDPQTPYFELNLAGNEISVANPASLAAQVPMGQVNAPTSGAPDFKMPGVMAFDLTAPGIDQVAPFQPDPRTGDLLQFAQPLGLQQFAASEVPMLSDPVAPDLSLYDRPDGLDMPGALMVDPALPDLQHPILSQEVAMPGRPGDLAPQALAMMHDTPTYEQLPGDEVKALWMAQQGNNSARERHLGMLMLGLDQEEG
ncbi:MAG: hypothetical protein NVS3B14_17770 [Ktedonobacteraceae bacterium]